MTHPTETDQGLQGLHERLLQAAREPDQRLRALLTSVIAGQRLALQAHKEMDEAAARDASRGNEAPPAVPAAATCDRVPVAELGVLMPMFDEAGFVKGF